MLPKPQSRVEDLLLRVINNDAENIPLPQSRLEVFLKALITNEVDNLPTPQSRNEMILYCILKNEEYNYTAQSRIELFLKAILDVDIEGLPTPMSRLEWYLDYIVRHGCLEKYEYYPFQIRDYLNVKNTPKARMKFKSMKGNTLVNIIDNSKIGQLAYSDGWINVSSSNSWQRSDIIPGNKKYTVFYEFVLSEDITFDSDNYNQFIRVDNVSNGSVVNDSARFVGNSYKANVVNRYMFILNEAYDTKLVIRNGIQKNFKCRFFISEGDHTQNPPPYFEGMKSFGESENKIEVLSTGINYFNNNADMWEQGTIDGVKGELLGSSNRIRTKDYIELPPKVDYMSFQVKEAGYKMAVRFYDNNKWMISGQDKPYQGFISGELRENMPKQAKYMKLVCAKESEGYISPDDVEKSKLQLTCNNEIFDYVPYGSSKAIPMYRNSSNELVPVPVLRGKWEGDRFLWGDEILEHEDGKLYYHKRCEKFILNGGSSEVYTVGNNLTNTLMFRIKVKSCTANLICDKFGVVGNAWSTDNELAFLYVPDSLLDIRINRNKLETQDVSGFKKWLQTNNVTVVYQLAEEVVYPCELLDQLYSFDGETNIFVLGGAVVGETTIEIGTKLGPIVATLKQETKIVTDGLKGVLAGDMQELAYQLYPDDFNKDNTVEMKPIESA